MYILVEQLKLHAADSYSCSGFFLSVFVYIVVANFFCFYFFFAFGNSLVNTIKAGQASHLLLPIVLTMKMCVMYVKSPVKIP